MHFFIFFTIRLETYEAYVPLFVRMCPRGHRSNIAYNMIELLVGLICNVIFLYFIFSF